MAVHVIDTIKPKNNGTFPVVEAVDVKVTNDKRLDAALNDKANQSDLTALQTTVSGKASQAELTALSETVSGKASQADLTTLSNTVDGKQNALSTAQLAACNSGITSELVTQIGTNTTAIAGKASQTDLETTNAAVATKASASDLSTETASLQAQIDAIVTPVTQDAEVENARVGADGTSYQTLKARLDASDNSQEHNINSRQPISLNGYENLFNSGIFYKNYFFRNGTASASSSYSYFVILLTANVTYYFKENVRFICKATGDYLYQNVNSFTPTTTEKYYITVYNSNSSWICAITSTMTSISPYQFVDVLKASIDNNKASINSINSDIDKFLLTSKNLLKDVELVEGYAYKNTPVEYSTYSYFKGIPVTSGSTYSFNFEARYVTTFDSSGTYQSYDENLDTYTAQADGFIYVTFNNTLNNKYELKCVTGTVAFDDVAPYGKEITNNLISDELSSNAKESVFDDYNLFDPAEVEVGFLESYGGVSPAENYSTSDYIPVKAGERYYISQFRKLLAYTNNKTVIDGSFINEYKTNYDFTATVNGYIRISMLTANLSAIRVSHVATHLGNKKIPEGVKFSNSMQTDIINAIQEQSIGLNPLFGKKWCVLGDSFTYGGYTPMNTFDSGIYAGSRKVYPYYIGNRTGVNISDFSYSGRTLAFPAEPGGFTNSITCSTADCYYQNIPADADYITIYLGINDSHHASGNGDNEDTTGYIPIGTVDDNTVNTFGGAWNVVLSWLIQNRPNAHIGIIVSNGCDTVDYRNLTIAIAKKYGIPYIDLNGDQITPAMIRTQNPEIAAEVKQMLIAKWRVSSSNTHPNDAAHEFESFVIEEFLKRI